MNATTTNPHRSWPRDLPALLGFLALTALAGASGALVDPGDWYANLQRAPGTPPDWLFPVAWTLLYVLMAIAAWLVWRRLGLTRGMPALVPWVGQLGANGLWSVLFFGMHQPVLALVNLLVLWALVALTLVRFRRAGTAPAVLLVPYLLWVTYAAYLNAGIVLLNPPAG